MQLLSIQYLRAIAALMVVLFHVELQLKRMGYTGFWPNNLAAGVDVFFVISGFIMWVTTIGRPGIGPAVFYRKRIERIVPLYWLLTSLVLAVMIATPGLMQSGRFDLPHAVKSYFFIPAVNPATGGIDPPLVPGWTLNYEMFFYLIFGGALLLPPRWRIPATAFPLVAIVAAAALSHSGSVWIRFYGSDIVLEFILGMILGDMLTRGFRVSRPVAWGLLGLGIAGLAATATSEIATLRAPIWGIPALFIVAGAVYIERGGSFPERKLPHLLGDASYSIYLSHGIALSAFAQVWRKLLPSTASGAAPGAAMVALFTLACLLVAILCGVLTYRLVEQPLTRFFSGKRKLAAAAVAGDTR